MRKYKDNLFASILISYSITLKYKNKMYNNPGYIVGELINKEMKTILAHLRGCWNDIVEDLAT